MTDPRPRSTKAVLFAATLGLAGALVFTAQPMAARQLLPWLGGAPAVWTTAQLFFQAALLVGYFYSHQLTRWPYPAQVGAHALVLGASLLFLPLDALGGGEAPAIDSPELWLLGRLISRVGPPFVALTATAPLLQSWFAARRNGTVDPYPLYVASNLGSLAALAAYPFVVEPTFALVNQARAWSIGHIVLALAVLACGCAGLRRTRPTTRESIERTTGRAWLCWVALAFVPSSLMLGATLFLTTDLAPVPLLWVVPLGLYLLSFVLAFARRPIATGERVAGWFVLAVSLLVPVLLAGWTWGVFLPLHLATFFLAAWMVHAEAARRRPAPERLTSFYLALAVGGVLGGLFNALVAPRVFDRVAEYPLGLFLACLAASFVGGRPATTWWRTLVLPLVVFSLLVALFASSGGLASSPWAVPITIGSVGLCVLMTLRARREPLRFALGVGAVLLSGAWIPNLGGAVVHRERDFFGVVTVTRDETTYRLFHGSTLHGEQDHTRPTEPLTYFTREGPIGDVMRSFEANRRKVAVVGLGVGSLAAYGRAEDDWTFFEIDPAVVRVASDPRWFRYLAETPAATAIVEGDARLRLRDTRATYDLIILDAFSSDAPPVHLLTLEAFDLYESRLAPGGAMAVNLTNRFLNLESVLAALVKAKGWACVVRRDVLVGVEAKRLGRQPSIWAVVARDEADLAALKSFEGWGLPRRAAGVGVWTDQSADLARPMLSRLRLGSR